jgi:hypothetical protein
MAMSTAATVTSLDGFHATPAAQRADELVRALFDAVNANDPARTDAVLARSFVSYDGHGTRSRTGLKRYVATFRVEDGVIAEHWESVDWVQAFQSFGLLSDEVKDG